MGRYSDSDNDTRRSKKKKKRASRSRSRSSSSSSYNSHRNKRKKAKKSKVKKRSPSPVYRRRDSRSRSSSFPRSYTNRRSRSQSRSPSRSRTKYRSHSRSRSPQKHKGRSPKRYRSRSRSRSRTRRSRSGSRSRSRRSSRSRSRTRSKRSRSRSRSRRTRPMNLDKAKLQELEEQAQQADPCANVPGFYQKTPAEQAEIRLQMALKAAAKADEKLKQQGVIPQSLTSNTTLASVMSLEDTGKRARAIEGIESSGFAPSTFTSSREGKPVANTDASHESAIFGGSEPILLKAQPSKQLQLKDKEALMHTNLYVSAAEKMDHWRQKLKAMRQGKLEGEAMA